MKFGQTLLSAIRTDLKVGIIPALMGEPGIGKSSFVSDLATQMGTRCFTLQCNLLADKADLTGGRLLKDETTDAYRMAFFPHEDIMLAIEHARAHPEETPILFLDEINRTTADVTSAALGLSTARRIGRERLPENLRIIVAGNDKGNITALDEASISRFSVYHVEPDAHTLIELLGNQLNPWVRTVLIKHPRLVFEKSVPETLAIDGDNEDDTQASVMDLFDSAEEMRQLTTPRTIHAVSIWLNATSREQLAAYLSELAEGSDREISVLTELIEAKVGNTGLALQLVATIAEDLAGGTDQQSAHHVHVPRPQCFPMLAACTTVHELENTIATLEDSEMSAALVYAISDDTDHTYMIERLTEAMQQISKEQMRTLVDLLRAQRANTRNMRAFLDVNTPMVSAVRPVLDSFL